jgi:hypothetical protein
MRKDRQKVAHILPGPRDCWHPYGLQMLRPDQFSKVVNSILRGDDRLLPLARDHRAEPGVYKPLFGDG